MWKEWGIADFIFNEVPEKSFVTVRQSFFPRSGHN